MDPETSRNGVLCQQRPIAQNFNNFTIHNMAISPLNEHCFEVKFTNNALVSSLSPCFIFYRKCYFLFLVKIRFLEYAGPLLKECLGARNGDNLAAHDLYPLLQPSTKHAPAFVTRFYCVAIRDRSQHSNTFTKRCTSRYHVNTVARAAACAQCQRLCVYRSQDPSHSRQ